MKIVANFCKVSYIFILALVKTERQAACVLTGLEATAKRDHAQVLPSGHTAANIPGLSTQVPMYYLFIHHIRRLPPDDRGWKTVIGSTRSWQNAANHSIVLQKLFYLATFGVLSIMCGEQ